MNSNNSFKYGYLCEYLLWKGFANGFFRIKNTVGFLSNPTILTIIVTNYRYFQYYADAKISV